MLVKQALFLTQMVASFSDLRYLIAFSSKNVMLLLYMVSTQKYIFKLLLALSWVLHW